MNHRENRQERRKSRHVKYVSYGEQERARPTARLPWPGDEQVKPDESPRPKSVLVRKDTTITGGGVDDEALPH